MAFIHTLLENLVLPLGDTLNRSSFVQQLRTARMVAAMSETEMEKLSQAKLLSVLKHATEHAPFYRNYSDAATASPMEWLQSFPVLTKQALRQQTSYLLTNHNNGLVKCSSSGSSGFHSVTYMDKHEQAITRAVQTLWWEWAGYRLGDPILQTGINPVRSFEKKIKDQLLRTYYLQAFSHSKEDVVRALRWAQKQEQPVLGGYAGSLYVLATVALEKGIEVKFKTAISWGDKLFDHYRVTIEKAFGCKTFENYGSAEGFMVAGQYDCAELYQMSPYVWIEILDDDGNPVPDGQIGNVAVTSLYNYTMPLIRYKLGDLAIKLPRPAYPLNRKLAFPFIQKVVGRDTGIVRTASGKYMVVQAFVGIFEHLPQISQFRVIQHHLDEIVIEYIPGEGFGMGVLDDVREKICRSLQEPFSIRFQKVEEIPCAQSGKPQLIVSHIKPHTPQMLTV